MKSRKNHIKIQLLAVTFLILFFMFVTRWSEVNSTLLLWVTDSAWTLLSGLVAWKCWVVSSQLKDNRKLAWQLFAYAHLSWFIGILIWDYFELFLGVGTPFPAFSDIGFMLFTIFFIAAMVNLRGRQQGVSFKLLQVGKLGIFASSIVIIHILVFAPSVAQSNESQLYIFASLLYPVLYMSAFLYALTSFWRTSHINNKVITLVIASISVHAFTVSIYAYSLLGKSYAVGSYLDVFWLIAFVLMYFAAEIKQLNIDEYNESVSIALKVQRYIEILITPVALMMLVIFVFIFRDNIQYEDPVLLMTLGLVLVFFLIIKEISSDRYSYELNLEVRKSEEKFRAISATVPGIVYQFSMDSDGKMTFPYVSPRMEEILGLEHNVVMQDPGELFSRIHPSEIDDLMQGIQQSYEQVTPWKWEGSMTRPDGSIGWYQAMSIPVKEDERVMWTGIIIDSTDEKNAKDELKNSHEMLEKRVKERTFELQQAMEAAEAANIAKSEFLSHMSHELRTPLNAVSGFAQLLLRDDLTASQKESVDEIVRAGNYLLDLITDLLDLAKIESGSMNLHKEPVVISPVVNDAIKMILSMAENHGVKLSVDKDEIANTVINVDEFRLKEILLNLLTNAIKYNRENGMVKVSFSKENGDIRITVTDNGPGIAQEKFSDVFKPFERIGAEMGSIEGTGIGLTICKRLTEMMGGQIGFDSEPGIGSQFWVEFPPDKKSMRLNQNKAIESRAVNNDDSVLILYVEDNAASVRLVETIFRQSGDIRLITAMNAEEGIQMARDLKPGIILMDINLPGIDGYEALSRLQSYPETREIPVIALSANSMKSDIEKGLNAGFDDYLKKPLDLALFDRTIKSRVAVIKSNAG